MTRKDYVLIAERLRICKPLASDPPCCHAVWSGIVRTIMHGLSRDNERFDRDRFLKASGVEL